LTPYWNYVVTLLPLWLAPNLITLLGLVAILVNVATVQVLVPDLVGPGPWWMYWSFVLGLWIYSTLDNVDGKQARRTGCAIEKKC
jgi:ethanolaminephosphotransferase